MKLIDADALKMKAERFCPNMTELSSFEFVTTEDIDGMPTALDIQNVRNALSAGVECVEEEAEKIEKIREEIDGIEINGQVDEHTAFIRTGEQVKQMALDIIDKYTKGVSE